MSNSVKTVTAAEKKRSAPKKRLLFIEEEPARVEKTKSSAVEEPKPAVAEDPNPAVVEDTKSVIIEDTTAIKETAVVEETKPAIIEEPKPSVVEEPKPAVVEEPKPAVVEETKPAIIEEPKPAVVEEPKKPQQSIWMQMRRISTMKIPLRWEGIEDISDDEDGKVDIQLLKMKKYQENIEYEKYLLRLEGFQSAGFFLNW